MDRHLWRPGRAPVNPGDRYRWGWSERLLFRLPVALLDYAFEVLLAVWGGLIVGLPRLLGVADTGVATSQLSVWEQQVWSLSLVGAAILLAAGLTSPTRRTALLVYGLLAISMSCLGYAIAILVAAEEGGIPVVALVAFVALLAAIRAWRLATESRITRRIVDATEHLG